MRELKLACDTVLVPHSSKLTEQYRDFSDIHDIEASRLLRVEAQRIVPLSGTIDKLHVRTGGSSAKIQ